MTIKLRVAMSRPRLVAANKARARVIVLSTIERFLSIIEVDIFNNVYASGKKVLRRRKISSYQTDLQEVTCGYSG